MNNKIRQFFEKLIALINEDLDVPIEAKRLVLYIALQLVEKQANEAIDIESKEDDNAKGIQQDKLAELSK